MGNYIILLVGASGTGKTTIADILEHNYGLNSVQSYTTRPRRYKNETGHTFVTKNEFDKLHKDMCAYTIFDNHEYCATNKQLDESDIYVIDPDGVQTLKENYIGNKKLITIQLVANKKNRKKRMLQRGDSRKKTMRRLKHDKKRFKNFKGDIIISTDYCSAEFHAWYIYNFTKLKYGKRLK